MRIPFCILCLVNIVIVCGIVLSEEKRELPETWTLLATDPSDQILLNELFEKVCALKDDKAATTSLLIDYAEQFKSEALKKRLYSAIATALEQSGDKKKAQEYFDKILDSNDGMTFSSRYELYQHYRSQKDYEKLLPLIENGISRADTPNETKAEWYCERLLIFAVQKKVSDDEIISECKKLESMGYEDPKSCYQRFHYLAFDLWDNDLRKESLALMKWLKEERYRQEYGIALLNNYAYKLSKVGNVEESLKVRMELIERHYADPAVIPQMKILIDSYIDENTPESREKAREWCHKILEHPKANAEDKKKAETDLELLRRLDLGQTTVEHFEGTPVHGESQPTVEAQRHLLFRSFLALFGLGLILGALYFKFRVRKDVAG